MLTRTPIIVAPSRDDSEVALAKFKLPARAGGWAWVRHSSSNRATTPSTRAGVLQSAM